MVKCILQVCLVAILLPSCQNNTSHTGTQTPSPAADSVSTEAEAKTYEGTFSYLADANLFISCDGKKRLPVEMAGDAYLTLEKKYASLSKGEGEKIYVRLKGFEQLVAAMEGNGKEMALLVAEVLEVDTNKKCN